MELKQHPLSAAFPAMSVEDFQELKDDIEVNGQREPVIVLDDMVLDGWHRYRACAELGLSLRHVPLSPDEDPVAFVLSHNLKRRHLTALQRAAAAAAGVSERTVSLAKTAIKAGQGEAVKAGKLSASQVAHRAAGKPAKPRENNKEASPKRAAWDVPAPRVGEPERAERGEAEHDVALVQDDGALAAAAAENATPPRAPCDEDGAPEASELAMTEREVAAELEALRTELAAMHKIVQADDKLAAAVGRNEQLRAENGVLEARNNDLLAENAKLVKKIKLQETRNEALVGEMAKLLGHIKALQSKLPACYGEDRLA